MTTSPHAETLLLGRRTLHALRHCLERETGIQAASLLQEAGFAGGEALHHGFCAWVLAEYGVDTPEGLDAEYLEAALSGFLTHHGWGAVTVTRLAPSVLTLDSADWAEAVDGGADYPSCHLSSGALADFFTRLGGAQTAVMEVECRSRGDAACRFLVGAPETLTTVYERMAAGMTYQQSLGV